MNYGHGPLADHALGCETNCNMSAMACPCPASCQCPEPECPEPERCHASAESMQQYHDTKDFVLACVMVASCFALVAFAFWVFA